MATFLFDKIIFGPVKSRRLGLSLGINLLPIDNKLCSFNCIYCECGWNPDTKSKIKSQFHSRQIVRDTLEQKLIQMVEAKELPDVITFAGNGEPTIHPEFESVIEDTIALRDRLVPKAKIAVLSNATMIHKDSVSRALNRIDNNILKLDGGFESTIKAIDQPVGTYKISRAIDLMSKFEGNIIIQTLFVKGMYDGVLIDNSTDQEVDAWLEHLKKIKPKEVMIYTIARDTPVETLEKVNIEKLNQIAEKVKLLGFKVQVTS